MVIENEIKQKFTDFLRDQYNFKPRAVKEYLAHIQRVEQFCGRDLTSFKKYSEASEMLIKLKKEGNIVRPGEPLSDRTIFKIASMIKAFWDFCALYEYMDFRHPFYLGHGFKKGSFKEPEFFDRFDEKETLKQILWHWEVPLRSRVILWVFYSTGIRLSELTSLNIASVRLEDRFIRVHANDSKNRDFRDVPFDEDCQFWLRVWIRTLQEYFGPKAMNPDFPLISNDNGERINANYVWKLLERLGVIFGCKMNPHKWRHSLAAFFVKFMPITDVAKVLGHKNIQTTYQYTHIRSNTLRNSYDEGLRKAKALIGQTA